MPHLESVWGKVGVEAIAMRMANGIRMKMSFLFEMRIGVRCLESAGILSPNHNDRCCEFFYSTLVRGCCFHVKSEMNERTNTMLWCRKELKVYSLSGKRLFNECCNRHWMLLRYDTYVNANSMCVCVCVRVYVYVLCTQSQSSHLFELSLSSPLSLSSSALLLYTDLTFKILKNRNAESGKWCK